MVRRTHFDSVIVVALLVAVLLPAYSESPPFTFERTYGGTADDFGYSVQQTTDGGYIVTGETQSFGAGGYDVYLVKAGPSGDTQWTRTFGGQLNEGGWSVRQTTDGGYVVVANADSSGSRPNGIWLIKTDANGDTLWTRTYAGLNGANMVEQTADAGHIITGNTSYFGPSGADVYLIKTDAGGETLWTRVYGGARDDVGNSVQQTTDGGYVVAGTTKSFGAGSQDIWLIKTDSMGDTLWTRTFGGDSFDFAGSAQQTADGGYFVAGTVMTPSDSPKVYIIKTDAVGDTQWTRMIGGPGWTGGCSGGLTRDGGYIVVGGCGFGLPDVYLVRTDSNGDTLWTRSFGGPDFDMGYQVQQTTDGGYVIVGQTYSFGAGAPDFYLIKTDSAGELAVAEPKAGPTHAPGLSLTCEPNPFSDNTRISLVSPYSSSRPMTLRVYDAAGRMVRRLPSVWSTTWDGRDGSGQLLPAGTYFIEARTRSERQLVKVLMAR